MTAPSRDPLRPRTLWAALLAGPIIGTSYFFVVYLAAEAACARGIEGFGTTALGILLFVATAATVGSLVVASAYTRRVTHPPGTQSAGPGDAEEQATRRFLGSTGLMLTALFLFFVLLVAAPAIGSSLC